MSLTAIILAAGKSTRMKSALPKPLHEVCGRPMLAYILDAAFAAGADKAIVVVGYEKEMIINRFGGDDRIEFVEQAQQLGTGHAAKMCIARLGVGSRELEAGAQRAVAASPRDAGGREIGPELRRSGDAATDSAFQLPTSNTQSHQDVLILAGDVPLIRADVLQQLVSAHRKEKADASLATAELENPFGYGRIIRDDRGQFVKIVEQADATPAEAAVREVFPSLYCVKAQRLVELLGQLKNNNAKREYYLTDIFALCRQAGGKVLAIKCAGSEDVLAPNTRAELANADAAMQARIIAALLESGVSIASPATTYVEAGAQIGQDTKLLPFTFIGSGATIGTSCTIGPFAHVARDAIVKDNTSLAGNTDTASMTSLAESIA